MVASNVLYPTGLTVSLPFRRYAASVLLFLLFACLWFREFNSFDGPPGIIYVQLWGNFRLIDAFLFGIGAIHFVLMMIGHRSWLSIPSRLRWPALLFYGALLTGSVHGRMNGGVHLFFDSREFVLAGFLIPVFAYWIRTQRELEMAVRIFSFVMLCRLAYIFIAYLLGDGVTDVIAGVRTPIFDGPTVSGIGVMALMAFRFRETATRSAGRRCWLILTLCGYLFVLASFRRTYWGELLIGTLILLILRRRIMLKNLGLVGLVLALAVAISGPMLYQRITNLAPTSADPVYAATNLDHLNDVLDAFDHIKEHPIAGIGVGVPYQTFRIAGWKTESWGVHNAIAHVWLLYGLFGLLTYLWLHFRLFWWLKSECRKTVGALGAFTQLTFAFAVAQFVLTVGFAPWPYGSLQNVMVTSFLLGGILGVSCPEKRLLRPASIGFPVASLQPE
jgi:O-Antigen ligase